MLVIGLTGGIGSGKSMVSDYLRGFGAIIIDADKIAREVVRPNSLVWQDIIDFFGREVLDSSGSLDRKRLGEIVFKSTGAREKLNSIVHPRVIQITGERIKEEKEKKKAPLLVVDAPLLIESGMTSMVDEVWLVYLPEEVQIQRVMKRDGISRENAINRIRSQMSLQEKLRYADRLIDNSGKPEETLQYVAVLWKELVQH